MKILILGDSLTFSHSVNLRDTWPFLLQKKGHQITHRGRGGSTIIKVLNELDEIEDWGKKKLQKKNLCPFDLCIIQVGIVDITPRPVNRINTYLLKQIPLINSVLIKLSKSPRFLKYFGKPWVSQNKFTKSIELLKEKLKNISKKTFFIEIARPAHNLILNCGDFSSKVASYNSILTQNIDKNFIFLPVFKNQKNENFLLRDGYHLNRKGHNLIFKSIIKAVKK